jgi:hypothetical protein
VMKKNPTTIGAGEARRRGGTGLREQEPRRSSRGLRRERTPGRRVQFPRPASRPGWCEHGTRGACRGARAPCDSRDLRRRWRAHRRQRSTSARRERPSRHSTSSTATA